MEFYRDFPNVCYIVNGYYLLCLIKFSFIYFFQAQITTFNCIFQLVFIIGWNRENGSISLSYLECR